MVLVDGHPILREAICRLLEADESFLVVGEANTGEEALDRLEGLGAAAERHSPIDADLT